MASVHVEVTAEDIAAAPVVPDVGEGFKTTHPDGKDPVELAIGRVTGQDVSLDGGDTADGPEIATIGQGANTLVVDLPIEQAHWIDRYYRGEPVEPFSFDIEIEDWIVELVSEGRQLDDALARGGF